MSRFPERERIEWDMRKTSLKELIPQIKEFSEGKTLKQYYIEFDDDKKQAKITALFEDDSRVFLDVKYKNSDDIMEIFRDCEIISEEKINIFGVNEE